MPKNAPCNYTDLLVRVHPWNEAQQYYPVEAWLNITQHFGGGAMRLEHAALQALEHDVVAYGVTLFDALFSGAFRRAYERAIGMADTHTAGHLRLRLWIDERAPELHALAWERLHRLRQNKATPLAAAPQTPFSRFTSLESAAPEPVGARPLRMLVAIANPLDLADQRMATIDVEREIDALTSALDGLQRTGQLHVTLLPGTTGIEAAARTRLEQAGYTVHAGPTTLDTLIRALTTAPGYHILHFLGHGTFNRAQGTTTLYFEDADGFTDTRRAAELTAQLGAINPLPHLIFMASCDSAKRDPQNANPYVGLAPQLVQTGIPAVIAMQNNISIPLARELSQDFYRELLEHGSIDRALSHARLLLLENDPQAWAIPALFMRLDNGQLFAADPVISALRTMLRTDALNPLPEGGAYLPMEVRRFSGAWRNVDFNALAQENTPGRSLIETILDIFAPLKAEQGPHGPSTVALVGDAGMGKSTEMRHIAQVTAQQSLRPDAPRLVIPVYVDLETMPQIARIDENMLETQIVQALDPFWEKEAHQRPRDVLKAYTGPTLRILLDNSEMLPYHNRRRLCAILERFIRRHARHEYVVAFNTDDFDIAPLTIHDTLIMLPLSERNIRLYLNQTLDQPAAKQLYESLEEAQLFDLAHIPWLLFRMLEQTKEGKLPRSHAQVLQDLIDDAIMDIALDQGMRTLAAKTLYTLAWEMQSTFKTTLTLDETFEIMAAMRGNRGYSLESLYQKLTAHGLLSPVGAESLRFTRASIRAYCCAQALLERANLEQALGDIAATLGRHMHYYWWEETLILLSALLDDPAQLINEILYGVALGEGEQVFLAADCIRECRDTLAQNSEVSQGLTHYVVSTLLWRLDAAREPRANRRVRIIQTLAHLKHATIIKHKVIERLADITYQPLQVTPDGAPLYEDSDVRLAAVMALRRIVDPPYKEVTELPAPELARILNDWTTGQVTELIPYLVTEEPHDTGIQAAAAFALGDLKTNVAARVLIRTFLSPRYSAETRGNVATALTLLDPALVTQEAILPFLNGENGEQQLNPGAHENPELWYAHLAYLIGKIRPQDGRARAFLYRCLNEYPGVTLKGLAMQAIGELYDTAATQRFTDIALGKDFSSLNLSAPSPDDLSYLQHKALDALFYIGDAKTLDVLKKRAGSGNLELEQTFYRTIERIRSRQNQQ